MNLSKSKELCKNLRDKVIARVAFHKQGKGYKKIAR